MAKGSAPLLEWQKNFEQQLAAAHPGQRFRVTVEELSSEGEEMLIADMSAKEFFTPARVKGSAPKGCCTCVLKLLDQMINAYQEENKSTPTVRQLANKFTERRLKSHFCVGIERIKVLRNLFAGAGLELRK